MNCSASRCTVPPVSIVASSHIFCLLVYNPCSFGYRARVMRPRHGVAGQATVTAMAISVPVASSLMSLRWTLLPSPSRVGSVETTVTSSSAFSVFASKSRIVPLEPKAWRSGACWLWCCALCFGIKVFLRWLGDSLTKTHRNHSRTHSSGTQLHSPSTHSHSCRPTHSRRRRNTLLPPPASSLPSVLLRRKLTRRHHPAVNAPLRTTNVAIHQLKRRSGQATLCLPKCPPTHPPIHPFHIHMHHHCTWLF